LKYYIYGLNGQKKTQNFLFVFDKNVIISRHSLQYTVIYYYNGVKFTHDILAVSFSEVTSI